MKIRVFTTLLFLVLLAACQTRQHPLDKAREYRPDNEYFKASLVALHFLTEVSPTDRLDDAYKQIISSNEIPTTAEGAKNGSYMGASPPDAFEYEHVVKLRIEDERIVEVDYNEILQGGMGKKEDTAYCRKMSVTGTSPDLAYPIYEKQLIEKQDIWALDAVSGATYSLYRFRYAVMVALIQAHL